MQSVAYPLRSTAYTAASELPGGVEGELVTRLCLALTQHPLKSGPEIPAYHQKAHNGATDTPGSSENVNVMCYRACISQRGFEVTVITAVAEHGSYNGITVRHR